MTTATACGPTPIVLVNTTALMLRRAQHERKILTVAGLPLTLSPSKGERQAGDWQVRLRPPAARTGE